MKDYQCYGHFSFIRTTGEPVNDGLVTFQFQNGHWTFAGYRWGPLDRSLIVTVGSREPMPNPLTRKSIESPYAPGVAWKRLPDGSYVKYDPNTRKANSK